MKKQINRHQIDDPDFYDIYYESDISENNMEDEPHMTHQYFSLRWNSFQDNMSAVFQQLLHTQSFVDVSLACEHHTLKAHKVRDSGFVESMQVRL